MTTNLPNGLMRLCLALAVSGALYLAVFVLAKEPLQRFLKWLDFLSAAPGLSGLALLVVIPVVFLAALIIAQWVILGFKKKPDPEKV